jgi:hypothetical protein
METDEALRRTLVAVRRQIPQDKWDSFADGIANARRPLEENMRADRPADNFSALLPTLKSCSHAMLPVRLTGVSDIRSHLDQLPVYKGPHPHTFPDNKPLPIAQASAEFPIVSYRWQDVVYAPGLMDQLNDPRLIDLIEAYLGCVPTLYGVNAYWSFPADEPQLYYQQHFHRDTDDWRFVALFIYLTDVDHGAGPHQLVPGSHSLEGTVALTDVDRSWNPFNKPDASVVEARRFAERSFTDSIGAEFSELCNRHMAGKAHSVVGPAGTMFLVNTLALHRGLTPVSQPRLVVWARYGLAPPAELPPPIPMIDQVSPLRIPDTPRNRYINRLIFDFGG